MSETCSNGECQRRPSVNPRFEGRCSDCQIRNQRKLSTQRLSKAQNSAVEKGNRPVTLALPDGWEL